MAADGGTVEIEYKAKIDRLQRDMDGLRAKVGRAGDDAGDDFSDRFTRKLHGLGSRVSGIGATIGKGLALGIAGAAVGIGALFKSSIDEAEEARKVGAQTAAVIQSTGGAANVSAGHVANYADKLAGLTGIDDELIASGQNMLLTFTRVRNEAGKGNDIFDQGTKAALNMSVALGKDLPGSAMLVGKALNDPIAGMTALTRSGIQFTAQQKDQVKAMVAAGDMLGAQKVILKELETQFGGSAEAAASPMARLKVVVGNLKEELGARLLPVVGAAATFLSDKLPGALDATGRALTPIIGGVRAFFAAFKAGDGDITSSGFAGQMERWAFIARTVFNEIRGGLIAFVAAFKAADGDITSSGFAGTMERIGFVVRQVVDFVRANAMPVLIGLGAAVALLIGPWFALGAALVFAYTRFEGFRDVVNTVVTTVVAIVSGFVDVVTTLWSQFGDQIIAYAQGAWTAVSGVVEGAMQVIRGVIQVVTSLIHGDWSGAWEGIKSILAGAVHALVSLLTGGMQMFNAALSAGIEVALSFVRGIPGAILAALGNLGSLLYEAGLAIMRGLKDGIVAGLGAVKDFVTGIAGKIISWKGPLDYDKRMLIPAGGAIMDSLVEGLRNHEGRLVRQLSHVTGLIEGTGYDMGAMAHSGDGGDSGGSSTPVRPINVGPFYVRENDLPTEIPRRLRGALHLWDR